MGTWLNPIDRSITTKYRIGCTKFSILSLITLSKLQHFFAKFFKKQFPQGKYKVTYRICCYFFCCVCVPQQFLFLEVCVKTVFLQHDTTTTTHYILQVRQNIWGRWGFTKKHTGSTRAKCDNLTNNALLSSTFFKLSFEGVYTRK